ncbi:MAG: FAD-binding and (Fe-S)-binding domain-containing protein, partial [Propionibacteriaceae bacterium]
TAVVESGVVLADLNRAAARYGLRYGPDPSTATRATIGGLIGNNACGPRAMYYGRTSDTIELIRYVDTSGNLRSTADDWPQVHDLISTVLGPIRTQCGRFPRQISGYSLEHLLPERWNPHGFWAGTEGTLGITVEATLTLAPLPAATRLIALGYPSMADAADDLAQLLSFPLIACEGLDDALLDVVRQRGRAVPPLPRGSAFLIVEVGADSDAAAAQIAADVLASAHALDGFATTDPALWAIRADAAGLAAVSLDNPAHAGWEDAAVPPERLGDYLRDFAALLQRHGLTSLPYGHFGSGCVHARIDFPLAQADGPARYRAFIEQAGDLIAQYGGSMSGEHGDGRARSELLPMMYSPEILAVFAAIKQIFDPLNLLNPGVIVDPAPFDHHLRACESLCTPLALSHPEFTEQVHRCTGVGACTAQQPDVAMCPSYRATGAEKDVTRGRARTLQEMIDARLITGGWGAPEVADALDLCLACKACRRECPTGVDLAALKSMALEQRWRGRIRPITHYSLGWLPRWLKLARRVPRLANVVLGLKPLARLAGLDSRRTLPRLATTAPKLPPRAGLQPVGLWVDSFSQSFSPSAVTAMAEVLMSAGYAPTVIDNTCCGLTWITTGQRDQARRQIQHALDILEPLSAAGLVLIGMEPSCTAVWRSDAAELLPDDPRVAVVARQMRTLAEFLLDIEWQPPSLAGHRIVAQPHCHHHAVLGWEADAALLQRAEADVVTLSGCCGLAGNFGMENGHYDVSVAVAELQLLPAIRHAGDDAIVLADGFSCRTQIHDLAGRDSLTLAQLLARHLQ